MGSTFWVAGSGAIARLVVAGFHVGMMVLGLNSAFARAPHAEAQTLVEDNVRGFRGSEWPVNGGLLRFPQAGMPAPQRTTAHSPQMTSPGVLC
jgi:hypothetical protein